MKSIFDIVWYSTGIILVWGYISSITMICLRHADSTQQRRIALVIAILGFCGLLGWIGSITSLLISYRVVLLNPATSERLHEFLISKYSLVWLAVANVAFWSAVVISRIAKRPNWKK